VKPDLISFADHRPGEQIEEFHELLLVVEVFLVGDGVPLISPERDGNAFS